MLLFHSRASGSFILRDFLIGVRTRSSLPRCFVLSVVMVVATALLSTRPCRAIITAVAIRIRRGWALVRGFVYWSRSVVYTAYFATLSPQSFIINYVFRPTYSSPITNSRTRLSIIFTRASRSPQMQDRLPRCSAYDAGRGLNLGLGARDWRCALHSCHVVFDAWMWRWRLCDMIRRRNVRKAGFEGFCRSIMYNI